MVRHYDVLSQLSGLGLKFRFFGRASVRELANVINEGESIRHCVYGSYQGGRALLVATDRRVLLIDKRPFFLNLEDIRYEMLSEVYFAGRLLSAKVNFHSGNRVLEFTSVADARLRKLYAYTQDQITKARQLEHVHDQVRPAQLEWSPYTMLGRPEVSRFSGRVIAHKTLQY